MTKISITGPKHHLQDVIETLHGLELLHIEGYTGDELETGESFEEAEELSQILVDVRSLLSKLPETGTEETGEFYLNELQEDIEEVKGQVERLEKELAEVKSMQGSLESQEEFFEKLAGSGVKAEDLSGTRKLDVFTGVVDAGAFRQNVSTNRYGIFEGSKASAVFYHKEDAGEVERALQETGAREIEPVETSFTGTAEDVVEKVRRRMKELESERQGLESAMEETAREWRPTLVEAEEFLAEKVEKADAPLNFATTERAFIAEGWVPVDQYERMKRELIDVTDGTVHVQREQGGEPPVKYDNSRLVQPFESLTDLIAVPKYSELDPSLMIFLTFPLLFGFMIGDAGYGLTTLAVFYAGYRLFPGIADIFKSLMYASVATIAFGLAFGDAFGYVIFGPHSELAAVTGIQFFEQIPILFHRAEHLATVFQIAAAFGVFHVNLGYMLGAYNEYINHGLKEAFLEKGSWLVLEAGIALWYFFGMTAGAPVVALSVALLYLGEGVEGVVEIPSLLSNILSYLRIFGVAVAAVSLAAVVNAMAEMFFAGNSVLGLGLGVFVLVLGHTFNTFIKIMEGFLQGIRLHYVELMTKFFEGGGKRYVPFGSGR